MGGTVNVTPKVSISTYWIHCRTRLHLWKSWGYFTIYGGSLVGLHTASTNQLPGLGCYFYSTIRAALDRKKLISWSHHAGTLITVLPQHLILVYQSAVDTFMVLCSVYCMYQPWRILISTAWEAAGRKKVALWSQRQRSTVQSVLFCVLLVPAMADGGNGRARALCFLKKGSSEAIYNVLLGSG